MNDLLDDENEEVLLAIATKLDELSKYIGGSVYITCLIPPLGALCRSEEAVVQERAILSLNIIAKQLSTTAIEENYIPLIKSLATST